VSTERYSRDVSDGVRRKIKFFVILVILSFLTLLLRVWYLQVLKGSDFMGLSESNRVRLISLPSYRGEITDRNGVTLASIRPSFNLYVTPEDVQDLDETLNVLKEKIEFDVDKVKSDIRQSQPFMDVLIKADIQRDQMAFVEENNQLLGGIHLKVEPLRNYLYGELAAHTLGYLGEINKDKLNKGEAGYRMGDIVGKEGIEFLFEQDMQGKKGYKEVEVDVSGRELAVLRKSPPQSGNHVQLTLDLRIQNSRHDQQTFVRSQSVCGRNFRPGMAQTAF
jgi:penicillin-binding protein 2